MEADLKIIFQRHSIRRFTAEKVSENDWRNLLQAAMAAPSARRGDPWRFVVLESQERREAIAAILEHGKFLAQAPLGILVCGDLTAACGGEVSYLLQDCSAAIENLLLAAELLDLGACWLGVHPRPDRIAKLSKLFDLPGHIVPVAVIAVGHPAERHEPSTRYDQGKVYYEKWGE